VKYSNGRNAFLVIAPQKRVCYLSKMKKNEGIIYTPTRLGLKLARLRRKKNLTVHGVCAKTQNVKRESLYRLEEGRTDPEKLLVLTMLELIHFYWPDLKIRDFTQDRVLGHFEIECRKDECDIHGV